MKTKYPTRKFKTNFDIERFAKSLIKNRGVQYLGSGAFAVVYGKNGRVWKIGKTKHHGNGYLAYVRQVLNNGGNNPYLPRIYDVTLFDYRGEGYYCVQMEHLIDSDNIPWGVKTKCLSKFKIECCDNLAYPSSYLRKVPKNSHEYKLGTLMRRLFRLVGSSRDTHDGNVMYRVTGNKRKRYQMVVTDPICIW